MLQIWLSVLRNEIVSMNIDDDLNFYIPGQVFYHGNPAVNGWRRGIKVYCFLEVRKYDFTNVGPFSKFESDIYELTKIILF